MDTSNCVISIIMPCFNHGKYIQEALASIKQDEILYPYEVIIVDDGSTDMDTLAALEELKKQGYNIIHQKNAGPAAARNKAIENSKGKYILPLDSDNMLTSEYINTGVAVLEKGEYQIVYCTPFFFGDVNAGARKFKSQPFDIIELLAANYIDSCALFLKEVWIKNKGFDTDLPYYGHEDWEFWINAYSNGFKFCFLKKNLFYYRIVNNSEADKFKDNKKTDENHQFILKKHAPLFLTQYLKLSYLRRKYMADINRFIVSPFIFSGYKLNLLKSPFKKAEEKFDKNTNEK